LRWAAYDPRMKSALLFLLLTACLACASVRADTTASTEITDYKLVALQLASSSDPAFVDSSANKYKFIRVIFTTSTDLAALSRAQGRDMKVSAYPCSVSSLHRIHDLYSIGPPVYDAYGEITHDRAVKTDSSLEKFKGLYYFFMPTGSRYTKGAANAFVLPYDLYMYPSEMCFETTGTTSTFFSNEVHIPEDTIKGMLTTPQPGKTRE
jgi:hypothetical protein